jgi:hypothetical protein
MIDEKMIQAVMQMHGLRRSEAKRKLQMQMLEKMGGNAPAPRGQMIGGHYVKPHGTQKAAHGVRQAMMMKQMMDNQKANEAAGIKQQGIQEQYIRALMQSQQRTPQMAPGATAMTPQQKQEQMLMQMMMGSGGMM